MRVITVLPSSRPGRPASRRHPIQRRRDRAAEFPLGRCATGPPRSVRVHRARRPGRIRRAELEAQAFRDRSVEDGRELADVARTPPAGTSRPRRQVVVVDVEADTVGAMVRASWTTAAIAGAASPRPRSAGSSHTPCTWQTEPATEPTSALNTTRPSRIMRERPAGGDQLADVEPVAGAFALDRRDADLLGVHRHRGLAVAVPVLQPHPAHAGIGLDQRADPRSPSPAAGAGRRAPCSRRCPSASTAAARGRAPPPTAR